MLEGVFMMSIFGGKYHVVYKKHVYRYKKNVRGSNISYWECHKAECRAKVMIKLAEKKVVGELRNHNHVPPTKVFEHGVWRNIGQNINKRVDTSARAKYKNISKTNVKAASMRTKNLITKVKNLQAQTTKLQKAELNTVEVQNVEVKTVKTPTAEVELQTTESEVQTTDVPTMKVQNAEVQSKVINYGIDFNMFTEVAPSDTAVIQLLENIPTDTELPVPTYLPTASVNSIQSNQPVYYESLMVNGLQIAGLAPPTEVLPSSNSKLESPVQPNTDGSHQISVQYVLSSQLPKKLNCSKHHHHSSCKRNICKRVSCNKMHSSRNIAAPATITTPVAQHTSVPVHRNSQHRAVTQPSNVAQISNYINLVCVQTDQGPQILALPQPAFPPKAIQSSSSAIISQPRHRGNAAHNSPILLDVSSPLVAQPTVVNQSDASNIQPYFQPSASEVIVKPSISNIDQPVSIIPQPSSVIVDKPSTYEAAQDSISKMNQTSSDASNLSPSLLTPLSSSMVSTFFTSLTEPSLSTSKLDHSSPLEIVQSRGSEVKQSASSVAEPSSSDVDPSSTVEFAQLTNLKVDQPFTSELDQSTLEINQSLSSEVLTTEVEQPSPFETSVVEQPSPFKKSVVEQPSPFETSVVEQPYTSEDKEPTKFKIEKSFASKVDPAPIQKAEQSSSSKIDQPSTSVIKTSESKVKKSTLKFDQSSSSSSEDYLPPEPAVKKTKVAKRISKPRMSKYRADFLLKSYVSDCSDID